MKGEMQELGRYERMSRTSFCTHASWRQVKLQHTGMSPT